MVMGGFMAADTGRSGKRKRSEQIICTKKEKKDKKKCFKHAIKLQLADSNGWGVSGTEFWVHLKVIKDGPLVTIQLPLINFQTGQVSTSDPYYPSGQLQPELPPIGGYLYTTEGFLPECVRPNDIAPQSIVAASNNGLSPLFSFTFSAPFLGGISSGVGNTPGDVLNVDEVFFNMLQVGQVVSGPGVIPGTIITAFSTGTGGPGTYTVNYSQYVPDQSELAVSSTLSQPPSGYIVQIRNDGSLNIQCAGAFGNIIQEGPQILLPCSITYVIGKKEKLCKNLKISTGATNITQFPNCCAAFPPLNIALRDSHVNDAYEGVVAFTWSDNSMVMDKTSGITNAMVAIGKICEDGTLKVGAPVQLTDFEKSYPANTFGIFNTAVTIVRDGPHKGNIVVSYGTVNYNVPSSPAGATISTNRAISIDNGQTWPTPYDGITTQLLNGPTNIQPSGPAGLGDGRGVACDKYGNVWYSTSNHFNGDTYVNQATIWVSFDGGDTYEVVYTVPLIVGDEFNDYPQICFGTNETGQYGLYFQTTFGSFITIDAFPSVGFIPIHKFHEIGKTSYTHLPGLAPALVTADITASNDGKVWIQGNDSGLVAPPYSFIQPMLIAYKSPSGTALDLNWAGAWNTATVNNIGPTYGDNGEIPPGFPVTVSQPIDSYTLASPQSIIYDDARRTLYALVTAQIPDFGQNMSIFFIISRDNGMTWSEPIEISTTNFANRGFQSMALDTKRGHLVFGWYDGRNTDPNVPTAYQTLEYFGAVIPAKKLTELIEKISPSNPVFSVSSVAEALSVKSELTEEQKPLIKRRAEAAKSNKPHGKKWLSNVQSEKK